MLGQTKARTSSAVGNQIGNKLTLLGGQKRERAEDWNAHGFVLAAVTYCTYHPTAAMPGTRTALSLKGEFPAWGEAVPGDSSMNSTPRCCVSPLVDTNVTMFMRCSCRLTFGGGSTQFVSSKQVARNLLAVDGSLFIYPRCCTD
jgi:hypothetical protein